MQRSRKSKGRRVLWDPASLEIRITATELARHLGDILGVRFRRDSFVIERKGKPIARVIPWDVDDAATLGEALPRGELTHLRIRTSHGISAV